MTKSRLINQFEVNELTKKGTCRILVPGRKYNAPMGLTVKADLKNAAKGIDEWVGLDKGNAYVLRNYEWVAVGDNGSTQLRIEFDTAVLSDK